MEIKTGVNNAQILLQVLPFALQPFSGLLYLWQSMYQQICPENHQLPFVQPAPEILSLTLLVTVTKHVEGNFRIRVSSVQFSFGLRRIS